MLTWPIYMDQFWLDHRWWSFAQWGCPTMPRMMWTQQKINECAKMVDGYDGVMVDIGAFTGDTMFPFAVMGWQVVAFEPNPMTYRCLEANARALPRVQAIKAAVGAADGREIFHYTNDLVNGGRGLKDHPVPVSVDVLTWNEKYLGGLRLGFLKIDAEGMDIEILHLMRDSILAWRPLIQIEIIPFLSNDECARLVQWCREVGYQSRDQNLVDLLAGRKKREAFNILLSTQ